MVRRLIISLSVSLVLGCALGFGDEPTAIKQTIQTKKQALQKTFSESKKGEIFYDLACGYYADQEIAQAFSHFLEALKRVDKKVTPLMTQEEKKIYEPALANYLAHAGLCPEEAARELLDQYGEIAQAHTDYLHLNFLIATAYANVGKYDLFFKLFYRSYPYLSDTFLAYKTRGILNLRLSQLISSMELRQTYQQDAFDLLKVALQRSPKDASLYKVLVLLAIEKKEDSVVRALLHGIVDNEVAIARGDIFFYVREAVALQEPSIGQAIIDRACALYDYSRSIKAAQEYLNQRR